MQTNKPPVWDYPAPRLARRNPVLTIAVLLVLLALHGILIWGISAGMSQRIVKVALEPVTVMLLDLATPKPEPLPAPMPPSLSPPQTESLTPPAPAAPMETVVAPGVPAAAATTGVTQAPAPLPTTTAGGPSPVAVSAVVAPAAPVARPVERTPPVVNAANCEKPEYPIASRRKEEEGTVYLRFLIGPDGQVLQSEVEKSSGSMRLDEAARGGLSKCKFRPATVGGTAVEGWASMKYTWRLE